MLDVVSSNLTVISVGKDPKTSTLHVTSRTYKVTGLVCLMLRALLVVNRQQEGGALYPNGDHAQNFLYLTVHPIQRIVTVWYNAWMG